MVRVNFTQGVPENGDYTVVLLHQVQGYYDEVVDGDSADFTIYEEDSMYYIPRKLYDQVNKEIMEMLK